jgi:hypothetical protein
VYGFDNAFFFIFFIFCLLAFLVIGEVVELVIEFNACQFPSLLHHHRRRHRRRRFRTCAPFTSCRLSLQPPVNEKKIKITNEMTIFFRFSVFLSKTKPSLALPARSFEKKGGSAKQTQFI